MHTLYKMAIKLGPKIAANPVLALEMAPWAIVLGAVALLWDAKE